MNDGYDADKKKCASLEAAIGELTQEDIDAGWLPINPDGSFPFKDSDISTGLEKDTVIH
jgi:hypothetical protein